MEKHNTRAAADQQLQEIRVSKKNKSPLTLIRWERNIWGDRLELWSNTQEPDLLTPQRGKC